PAWRAPMAGRPGVSAWSLPSRTGGAVAVSVGNGGRRLRRDDGIGSGGEVNRARGWWLAEALPTVDLAHGDLARGEQCPEQHRGGLGRGQHGLRLDAALELLVQPLDRVGGAGRLPLARGEAGGGAKTLSPLFSAAGPPA